MRGRQRLMRIVFPLLTLFVLVFVTACGGGGARLESESYSTTLGQELKDLDDAYKKGIITEKQYETSKKRLIEQRTGR